MCDERLAILGGGTDLPRAMDVRELVESACADATRNPSRRLDYHTEPANHPSVMGERAPRRTLQDSGVATDQLRLMPYTGKALWACGVGAGPVVVSHGVAAPARLVFELPKRHGTQTAQEGE